MRKVEGSIHTPASPQTIYRKLCEVSILKDELYGTFEEESKIYVKKASELCGVKYLTDNIISFALNFQEDVAIIRNGVLDSICFCFPSGWVPSSRIGNKLSEIHSHIPDSDRLVASSDKISEVMTKQSFERFVWTISHGSSLSQHPKSKLTYPPTDIEDLFFRTERQTTMPLDENSSLFFVNVNVKPLTAVFQNQEMKQKIIDSVNSMSENILKYKGLKNIKEIINRLE